MVQINDVKGRVKFDNVSYLRMKKTVSACCGMFKSMIHALMSTFQRLLGDNSQYRYSPAQHGGNSRKMVLGVVKWFDPKKGYGFIVMNDGQEVFVHYSAIDATGFRSLEQGQQVKLEVAQGPKGLQAAKVTRA